MLFSEDLYECTVYSLVTYRGSLSYILPQEFPRGEGGELRVPGENSGSLGAFPAARGPNQDDAGSFAELVDGLSHCGSLG